MPKEDRDLDRSFAIGVIFSIEEAVLSKGGFNPQKTLSAITQISLNFRFIQEDLKQKARTVFSKLWENQSVLISTDPAMARENTEVFFEGTRVEKVYLLLPAADRTFLRQGQVILTLQGRGVVDHVEREKDSIFKSYGIRGLTISRLITARDIGLYLDEISGLLEKPKENAPEIISIFDYWVENYLRFTILVSPSQLSNAALLKEKIISLSSNGFIRISIHLIGTSQEVTELSSILLKLKEDRELNYSDIKLNHETRGFATAFSARLVF